MVRRKLPDIDLLERKRKGTADTSVEKKPRIDSSGGSGTAPATGIPSSPPSVRRQSTRGKQTVDLTGGTSEDAPGAGEAPGEFHVKLFDASLDRTVMVTDSVKGQTSLGLTLLRALCLPRDMDRLPKSLTHRTIHLMNTIAQVGQAAVGLYDEMVEADARKEERLGEASRAVQDMEREMSLQKRQLDEALSQLTVAEQKHADTIAQMTEQHKKELVDADEKGYKDGQDEAIATLEGQVDKAVDEGRQEGMAQGFTTGYRQALTALGIPQDSPHWEVPTAPQFVPPEAEAQPVVEAEQVVQDPMVEDSTRDDEAVAPLP